MNSGDTQNNNKRLISELTLSECDCDVGLNAQHWNPKMKPYISSKSRGRYMFDVSKIKSQLEGAFACISNLVSTGEDILFVGVKNRYTAPIIAKAASRVNAFYLTKRWFGGLLTNFKVISLNIKKLNELDELLSDASMRVRYTKKELIQMTKHRNKLEKFFGGIRNLQKLPDLIVLFNPKEDISCLLEAKKMGITVIALSNINADPDLIRWIIPGNNTSLKSVYLIANLLCDAVSQANGNETLIAYKNPEEIFIPEEYQGRQRFAERGNISLL